MNNSSSESLLPHTSNKNPLQLPKKLRTKEIQIIQQKSSSEKRNDETLARAKLKDDDD